MNGTSTRRDPYAEAAFSSLYETVLNYFFSSYGYPRSVAQAVVSKQSVREICGYTMESGSGGKLWLVDDNCTLDEVGRQLRNFVAHEEYSYFLLYLAFAIPLITLAILFNSLAVWAISKIRRHEPRHYIAISLSVSDLILTSTTLIKRCATLEIDWGPLDSETLQRVLEHDVNVIWQSAFVMSALGLVCMAADNLIAVVAPFRYGSFVSSSWIRIVMPLLWIVVLMVMIGLRLANLNYSLAVQYIVATTICTLLFVIFSAYGTTCFQALLYRRRTNQWAQPEQKEILRRGLLKGFFTTTLLVLTCLLSWGPLVCYLLVDDEVVNAAHPVFLKFLLFSLVMFHLGAVLNPVIYSMRIRGIRQSLLTLLHLHNPTTNTAHSMGGQLSTYGSRRMRHQIPKPAASSDFLDRIDECKTSNLLAAPKDRVDGTDKNYDETSITSSHKNVKHGVDEMVDTVDLEQFDNLSVKKGAKQARHSAVLTNNPPPQNNTTGVPKVSKFRGRHSLPHI